METRGMDRDLLLHAITIVALAMQAGSWEAVQAEIEAACGGNPELECAVAAVLMAVMR